MIGMTAFFVAIALGAVQPAVSVEADSSLYEVETRRILLEGNVRLIRAATEDESELTLSADRIEGRIDGLVEATGDVRIFYREQEIRAERGEYDYSLATGRFSRIAFERDSWFVTAEAARLMGMDRYRLEEVRLTACDRTPPDYYFRVGSAEFRDNRLTARGLWMVIGKTPVAWFPWISMVPGRARPPVRILAGQSGFEGYFVKLAYLYDLGRLRGAPLGDGDLKLDYRSRRGWGYGIDHKIAIPRGSVRTDLYRIDERNFRARGVARAEYQQDLSERLRTLGEIHYVTDATFRQDYRFKDYIAEPDPESGGSVTYRGDAGAFMIRVAANANRAEYDLIERLPEARVFVAPRSPWRSFYLDGDASITAFRHSHPRDSGAVAWNARMNPDSSSESLIRWNSRIGLNRPTILGGGWILTPFAGLEMIGTEDAAANREAVLRTLPSIGARIGTFRRYRIGENLSWSIRPSLEFEERGIHGRGVSQAVIIEHIDQRRDARFLKLVLDQGILGRRGGTNRNGTWTERLRLRLDGGADFDRVASEQWLPIVGRVNALFGRGGDLEGELTFDPNRDLVRLARLEARWNGTRRNGAMLRGGFGWRLRRGDYGVDDQENIDGNVTAGVGAATEMSLAASYSRTMGRLDYARAGIRREFHCWILGVEVTDYGALDRFDIRATAELKLP